MDTITGYKNIALSRHRTYKNPHLKGVINSLVKAMLYEKDPSNKKILAKFGIMLNLMTLQ